MPRLAILNMAIGFFVVFVAASAGAFISLDITHAFLYDEESLHRWQLLLHRSAHGHTNLFGMLHILFGLTLPYSLCSQRIKIWQTAGLLLGCVAMGPGMILRGAAGPTAATDGLGIALGLLLSATLLAVASHALGLMLKFSRRH